MKQRVYNFCPGPCTLPLEVLEETQSELVNYKGTGMSLVEHSHRGPEYDEVHNETVSLIRELLEVPEEFSVLLIQGGATMQFAMVAMNVLAQAEKAAYVNSGHWAKLALKDAQVYGNTYVAWDGADDNYSRTPVANEISLQPDTQYLHITTNETIGGIRTFDWPDLGVPLVADMSSDYMSRKIPWNLMDVAYGGAQKNIGPSGVAVVIVRKSLMNVSKRELPSAMDYRKYHSSGSRFNTPPVFPIYVAGKVLKWYKERGGVEEFAKVSIVKSGYVYDAIDASNGFYDCPVTGESRSRMNVVFRLPSEELEAKFLSGAEAEGLVNLKGHRSVGGMRASIYNAMPMEGAEKLASFMDTFRIANS